MKKNPLESLDQPVLEGTETEESSPSFPECGWERKFNAEVWKASSSGLYTLAVDDGREGLDNGIGLTIVRRRLAEIETIPETPYAVFREFGRYHFGGLTKPLPPSPVGGDCVAVIPAPDGSVVVAVTDAEGKGAPAAVPGRTIYRLLRSAILSGCGPLEKVLFKLNGALRRESLRGAVVLAKIGVESVNHAGKAHHVSR